MKSFLHSFFTLWRQLGLNQRVSLTLAALAVVGGLIALTLWSGRPDLQLLYGRLADKDAAVIISQLQAQNIPYRASPDGSTVYVPGDQVHRLRMELAAKGLPSGEGVGFEIFDKGQFGLSDFVQRTNYLRAVQGELARTISQLDGVRGARVMIVQPENRLLLTDQSIRPTASVFVELAGGRMESEAVNSIRHLVANAVQGLTPDQVAVVDQKGRVLSEELKQDPTLGTASSQIRYRQQVEDYLAKKVESLLRPVVGVGNAVVRVSAEIDTEAATMTQETFDPDGQVVRTQTQTDDINNTTEQRGGGVVGISANVPDRAGAAADERQPTSVSEQSRKNRTTTYEINRSLTQVTRQPGTVKNVTAAVLVAPRSGENAAPRTPEELAGLRQIVINALGLRPAPGQSVESLVSLQELPFQGEPMIPAADFAPTDTRWQKWVEIASRYGAVLLAGLIFFFFWRSLKKQKPEAVPIELLSPGAPEPLRALPANGTPAPEMLNELIRQKPANVSTALREWVAIKKSGS